MSAKGLFYLDLPEVFALPITYDGSLNLTWEAVGIATDKEMLEFARGCYLESI